MAVEALWKPRIKPEHAAYRTTEGNIRIGSVIFGIGAEIKDPAGWLWTLASGADGTRTEEALIGHVLAGHPELPELTEDEVGDALRQLNEAGFVEDAAAERPAALSEREAERYSRGVPLLRWMDLSPRRNAWEAQARLKESAVLLIGLGGVGGMAAQALVASGVGRLHCVDSDRVELSNLNRQTLYREADLGSGKVAAGVAHLQALNSDVRVTGQETRVGTPGELAALLSRPPAGAGAWDALLLCADQPSDIRRWTNLTCLTARVPWVDGGYRGPLITVGVYRPGRGGCYECLRTAEYARRDLRLAPGQDESRAAPRMAWNPVNAVTAGVAGSLMAHAVLTLLTGIPPTEPGFRFGVNLMALDDATYTRDPARPDCPACGTGR
ncbi:ThiF family adenylyltransferase [Streptomyces sp. MP131-18]|uniref:HesA/MoeB/ThiF family protein n=1 Tax=Streptomyces sp. MP131-18 TaxID=1857892 RepID=UPI0009D2C282|nr:ThiF family adenylyltransferase [Streptomyces sp. MP131-18]ONK11485.1 Molybdopterin-synthase adenylyltransferase [Streptomyces sp. MP131-18]